LGESWVPAGGVISRGETPAPATFSEGAEDQGEKENSQNWRGRYICRDLLNRTGWEGGWVRGKKGDLTSKKSAVSN